MSSAGNIHGPGSEPPKSVFGLVAGIFTDRLASHNRSNRPKGFETGSGADQVNRDFRGRWLAAPVNGATEPAFNKAELAARRDHVQSGDYNPDAEPVLEGIREARLLGQPEIQHIDSKGFLERLARALEQHDSVRHQNPGFN